MLLVADRIRKISVATILPFAAGCMAVPADGPPPKIRDVTTLKADYALTTSDSSVWPDEDWWKEFADPQLDALVSEALANSPDVVAAAARLRRAAATAREEGGARLPSLDASASGYEERRSLNNGFSNEIKQYLPRGWRSGGDASVSAGFDLDLWGRNRAAHAAATSEMRAAAVDLSEARLMLASAIAYAYTDLAQLYAQRDLRQSSLDIRASSRDLVSKRLDNGLEMRGSLRQADAQVAQARSDLEAAEALIALRKYQIAALLGAGPDRGLAISKPAMARAISLGLPAGVTTELVARRPDIVAAKERVEAASRRIDVARADFFPSIRLDALIGLQAIGLSSLLESDSTYGRAGPALSLPIFHGGGLRARYRSSRATYEEAVAHYDATVIGAYREVAEIMTRRASVSSRLSHGRDAVDAAGDAYEIATLRYKGGLSSYLDALTVEDRLLEARLAVTNLEAEAQTLNIELIHALGGGFRINGDTPSREKIDG